ncbi:methyl-accepting chemotaxis protein [Ureibacillus chungkukjangi]|uniref:methyl-accepting chemotaxis protein n=1 Tax=Ureibacillus chungkukjangi TaxID=1202712 RepID=UPI00204193B0|nr:methyl-accepting chemotaxis protein [Ureibacillus chungkukjangi]MCM3390376.1 methyl-accepting chemotaxis protein [Ureibacillus chungkukjangi]
MTKINKRKVTLKKQFIIRILMVMILVIVISSSIQLYFMLNQIKENVDNQARLIGGSIEQGVIETNLASEAIEHQLDLKLKVISQRIADHLDNQSVNDISNEDLTNLKEELGLAGITLLAKNDDDIVGTKSTDPNEIGFSFKEMFGPDDSGFLGMKDLLNDVTPVQEDVSYVDHNTIILYAAQSGVYEGQPKFFKYAYYHKKGQDFIIAPYIEADEVYKFTEEVGPNSWINKVLETNEYTKEVAVIDPRVVKDPSLAEKMYPPLEKVVYGSFELEDKKDKELLISMIDNPKKQSYVSKFGDQKLFKMFLPMDDGHIIYMALDYSKMSKPVEKLSILLIAFGVISLLVLFIMTARFFSVIYKHIQVIMNQIKTLESGDFTTQSKIEGSSELVELSNSTNHMTSTLNKVLKDTTKQAQKVQTLSSDLKSEADDSVEKVYALSIDLTSKAREDAYEINDFLEMLEEKLNALSKTEVTETILARIEEVRSISSNRAASATEITITLSDLMKSLQDQSIELSEISSKLFENMYQFKLK